MKCPHCDFENPPGSRYCGMCGARLARPCPACGSPNPLSYRYCSQCGILLTGEPIGLVESTTAQPAGETMLPRVSPADIPAAEPRPTPLQLEGERRVATVILADVTGSTDLLEQLGTETWVEIMNQVLQILEAEIYRFGGKVDQFRGDGLVAFFGTTSAHEDDPERAVLAALAMQHAIKRYAADLAKNENIDLRLRVGVNTGEVIVTSVGDDRQYREDTAMGEAIAIASRMETAAEPGTVLVSENTYRLLEAQFEWKPLGEIMVKGVSHPIPVYRPLALRATAELSQTYCALSSPLIGRDAELETLKRCVEDLHDGLGGIVMVMGENGMGKSLLVSEMRHHFARRRALFAEAYASGELDSEPTGPEPGSGREAAPESPPVLRELRGRARSYEQSQPYAMWQDLLRNWLGIRQDEPKEETRDRLRLQTEKLWGERMIEYYPDLATFLSLPLERTFAEQIKHLDAEGRRQQFFLAIRGWVEALVQEGPLVITFSDMHWADTTSLDLLKYCLPLCDYSDLLWLLVFRPDRTSPVWEFRHYVETEYPHRLTTLTLPPLTAEQSEAFIGRLIGPDVLPPETKALLVNKSEGNPYYIQELVRSLIVQGVLVQDKGACDREECGIWRATQAVTSITLPDSLQSLLLARIDNLSAEERHVLQMAAVIGTVFWSKVLRSLASDAPNLKAHLTALQRAQLISERGRVPDIGVEYFFKSKLIRDAAYESLLSAQRLAYHLQTAEYLETHFCDEGTSQSVALCYGTLAYHYSCADRPDKELYYTLQRAEKAKEIYANAEAGDHYTHALKLLDAMEAAASEEDELRALRIQRFQVLNSRREVFYLMGKFDAMRADAQALLPVARQLGDDPVRLIDALLQQPGVADYQNREEIEAGAALAQQALRLAQQLGDQRREMESLIAIVNQRLTLSDPTWQETAECALDLARKLDDKRYEARLLIGMGGVYAFSDQPERSMEYLEAAAALVMGQCLDDKLTQMSLLNLLGLEFERNGDYYRLLMEFQQERLHASREIGHRPMESKALQACGRIQGIYLGDYAEGLSLLEECQQILRGTQDEAFPLFHIVQIQTAQYRYEAALETLERLRQIGDPIQDRACASLYLVRIILYNALGTHATNHEDPKQAEAFFHMTLDLAEKVRQLAANSPLVSRQYEMAAACKATVANLSLARDSLDEEERQSHLRLALESSQAAYDIYQFFGFVQIAECSSEEILFRHSQAMTTNGDHAQAIKYLRRAYDEMIRKHAMIPPDSHFRRTYLEAIPLHQEIRAAYAARVGSILTETGPLHQALLSEHA